MSSSPAPRQEFILVPHTHWDREWYLPFEVFRQRLVRLLDRLVAILAADPDYKFFHLDGQTIVLEDYEAIRGPHDGLRRLVREGRIQVGPWYVLPDEFLVSGESLVRNFQEGFRVAEAYGAAPAPVGYLPDMFGHVAQMPQILAGFGLDNAVVWRGITPDVTQNQFTWKALDGSSVFAAFLPMGYGFAFGLPEDPKRLVERLQLYLLALKKNEKSGVILLPNGTDHYEPQAHIPKTLRAVNELKPDWRLEMADFPTYLQRVRERAQNLPEHQGELRSADRTLILPNVASARLYLKQLDFQAGALLERYLEPLTSYARALGGDDQRDPLRYLWRLLLQNHPHDSICGCSVDAVHDEMETRYAKARQLSERLLGEALAAIAGQVPAPGPRLCAYFPNAAPRRGPLAGEVEIRLPARPCLVGDDGQSFPAQADKIQGERTLFEITVPKIAAGIALDMLAGEEVFGLFPQGFRVKRQDATLSLLLDLGSRRTALDLSDLGRALEKDLADPKVAMLHLKVALLPRYRIAAQVPEQPGLSIQTFQLKSGPKTTGAAQVQAGPDFLENEFWRIQVGKSGHLSARHKPTGQEIAGLRFHDVADRGDEYNFDPLDGDVPITEPVSARARVLAQGPVAAELEVRHRFRVPAGLEKDRQARSRKTVALDLATRIRLSAGSPTVEFHTAFVNRAGDHRLQVAFDAPISTDAYSVETAFGAVVRPIEATRPAGKPGPLDLNAMILGVEGTYGTSPQKTYAAISDGARGMALFNRGLAEVEAARLEKATRLALTLVRSVGWLSRGDLRQRSQHAGPPMPTPGGQCLREMTCEYALTAFAGSEDAAGIPALAHAYAFPPLLFTAPGTGQAEWISRLIELDNPAVELSALVPVGPAAFDLRLFNTSPSPQTCRVSLGRLLSAEGPVDLRGRKISLPEVKLNSANAELRFRPYQFVTLRLGFNRA